MNPFKNRAEFVILINPVVDGRVNQYLELRRSIGVYNAHTLINISREFGR